MTFEIFLVVLCVGLPIYLIYNYKFASFVTNAYLFRKCAGQLLLAGIAVAEHLYFDRLFMSMLFVTLMAWEHLKMICGLSIIGYIVFAKKLDGPEVSNYIQLFTKWKVRNFAKSESFDVYFLKNDGVDIYFDRLSSHFESLSSYWLDRFKDNIKKETTSQLLVENFIVLHCDDNYVSVSSDDLTMLDIDLYNIDKNHFEILRMFKI